MSISHAKVAEKFVSGGVASGSRMHCVRSILGATCYSYSTAIACIRDDRLLLTTERYSASTMQHKSLILSAWGKRQRAKGYAHDTGVYLLADIGSDASEVNVMYWVDKAADNLTVVLNNRCRPNTRYFAWRQVHSAARQGSGIFWVLPTSASSPPSHTTTHRLKAFTELCSAIPLREAEDADEAALTDDELLRIRAVMELLKE